MLLNRLRKRRLLCFAILFTPAFYALCGEFEIRYPVPENREDTRYEYYVELLKIAMEHTLDTHGAFLLTPVDITVTQGRAASEVAKAGDIDVFWTTTSRRREEEMSPVRVPLLKGLMGYRIGFIQQGDQQRFSDINTINQLQQLSAGQGYDWPDAQILQANQFTVMAAHEPSLHTMLKIGRFDYFPRGIHELPGEADYHSYLAVEKTLLFHYPAPMFFFVSQRRPELTERLHAGLLEAIEQGTFDNHFNQRISSLDLVERFGVAHRRLIRLRNPLLTEQTQRLVDDKRFWLDLSVHCKLEKHCALDDE